MSVVSNNSENCTDKRNILVKPVDRPNVAEHDLVISLADPAFAFWTNQLHVTLDTYANWIHK